MSKSFRSNLANWCKRICKTDYVSTRKNRVEDLNFRFYNSCTVDDYVDVPLSQSCQLFKIDCFNLEFPTIIYAHGYTETPEMESCLTVMSAYLEYRPATNPLLLDWSNMAQGSYLLNAAWNTKKVGVAAAESINDMIEAGLQLDSIHLIGHSLGGHVVGYTARILKKRFNKTVKRITALDPAFPGFYPNWCIMQHINANDAEMVDIIHTDACCYGAPVGTGTADFWPNGGRKKQPGCPNFPTLPFSEDSFCNHWRSWMLYVESLEHPENFPASPAKSYKKFKQNQTPEIGMVYMGINCDPNARGSYYLTTNGCGPFGKGLEGIYFDKIVPLKKLEKDSSVEKINVCDKTDKDISLSQNVCNVDDIYRDEDEHINIDITVRNSIRQSIRTEDETNKLTDGYVDTDKVDDSKSK